ncbi:thioredoxin domain-containing protein [Evtepia gabavorous]|uniref:thioredoxin domain-containing protein n=1 Tax=Evtepia gabavorous TaxID=2211183 RepID=UPI003AB73029
MSNHLRGQTSPYLLQHADNPVDWYPWGREALQKAKIEDKPIFLSIGYSTCHWCHVMARESFEDLEIARLLNESFVSIKVDREERPDIDSLYMAACQAFTGSGGWPTTLFLTPEQLPFFAGTYFPPTSRGGLTGLRQLLSAIRDAWAQDREALTAPGRQFLQLLTQRPPEQSSPTRSLLEEGVAQWKRTYDETYGGFGAAPKFPMGHSLLFLLTYGEKKADPAALAMAEKTLEQLYRGGIYDHIGGGFCRYSTDRAFRIPHFEKMLYDNALLMLAYCKAYAITGRTLYRQVATETAGYLFKEMSLASGAFVSAQDADSDGSEGAYYALRPEEVLAVLGEDQGTAFNACYDITEEGNFHGFSIPNLLHSPLPGDRFAACIPALYAYRLARASLHRDDKVLAGWNGLLMGALSWLYRVSGQTIYRDAARGIWTYLSRVHGSQGTLSATSRDGLARGIGFLEDYAFCAFGLLSLYEATLDPSYLSQAQTLCRQVLTDFTDPSGGFFLTPQNADPLLIRPKDTADGALPSGNTMMAWNLVRLSHLTREDTWQRASEAQMAFLSPLAASYPTAYPVFLLALLAQAVPAEEITVVLAPGEAPPRQPWPFPLDAVVTILEQPTDAYPLLGEQTTYYVCKNHSCLPPCHQYPS